MFHVNPGFSRQQGVLLIAWVAFCTCAASNELPLALATADQIDAENVALAVMTSSEVIAQRERLRATLLSDPIAATPDGLSTLDHAVDEWTNALIYREIEKDTASRRLLWDTDDTPHAWFGHSIPGAGKAVDNPDHIYRGAQLDGAARYEIRGRVMPNRPAQFTFEITRQRSDGTYLFQNQSAKHVDMGNQLDLLRDTEIRVDAEGNFLLTLDSAPVHSKPHHLHIEPGPVSLIVRDVLSDWTQSPIRVQLRRLDKPPGEQLTEAQIRDRVVAHLPDYIRFWAAFKDTWLGGLMPNSSVSPVPRDGGWGFQSGGRFDLGPDEVMVITLRPEGAAYTGIHITDPWMLGPDARLFQSSLNPSQSLANADGSITYVISPTDPEVANWIDTAKLHHGYFAIRWEGLPIKVQPDRLLRSVQVVKFADLKGSAYADLPRVSRSERQTQLARRSASYAGRLGL